MLKSLQSRLLLSYIIIILACLVLVGLAALLLLRGYQRNLIVSQLGDRAALAAGLTTQMLRRGASPEEATSRLEQQVNRGDGYAISVLLLDPAGHVVAGGDGKLDDLVIQPLPSRPAVASGTPPVRGEKRLPTGERFLYVAEPLYGPGQEGPRTITHFVLLGEIYRPVRLALGDLIPRLMWAGAIALAVSVVAAALMAYSIARPLERIAQAAEDVAAGDYDQRLQIESPTEVARLANSFNIMAQQVHTTLQSQQDLVANVSHELKTPLTSIQGFSQALVDGTASDEPARERAATIIHEEAARMRRLVDELLDLARLESGQVSLAREPVNVVELLDKCAARFAPQAEQAGSTMCLEVPASLPPVMGDADRLGRVFGNLVDNALKQIREVTGGGQVVLNAKQQDRWVVCSVTDNGPGIPTEDLSRVFERFYQVDKSRARRGSGAGLGLAIAQGIVEAHDGSIRVESVEGLGTRFVVELPAVQS